VRYTKRPDSEVQLAMLRFESCSFFRKSGAQGAAFVEPNVIHDAERRTTFMKWFIGHADTPSRRPGASSRAFSPMHVRSSRTDLISRFLTLT